MELFIVRKVLEANEKLADEIRNRMTQSGTLLVNIMSSPGSGKTMLLQKVIPQLQEKGLKVGVIEGDITTTKDAERLQPLNIQISQINTEPFGGDCHLGSEVILPALAPFNLSELDIVFIENVGNLVCPAEFDTGSHINIVLISVAEGEDKPLKYPLMFRVCHYALVTKIDLLPYLDFNIGLIEQNMRNINPKINIGKVSSKTGDGISEFTNWLTNQIKKQECC